MKFPSSFQTKMPPAWGVLSGGGASFVSIAKSPLMERSKRGASRFAFGQRSFPAVVAISSQPALVPNLLALSFPGSVHSHPGSSTPSSNSSTKRGLAKGGAVSDVAGILMLEHKATKDNTLMKINT